MKCFWLFFTSLLFLNVSQAYTKLKGNLVNQKGEAIPYAILGIEHTKIGSITNSEGGFKIDIPKSYHTKKLIFQAPGFKTMGFRIDSLYRLKEVVILLKEDITRLRTVEVKPNAKLIRRVKGNKGVVFGNIETSKGPNTAFGVMVKPPEFSQLKSIMFHVQNDSVIRFRVRPVIYKVTDGVVKGDQNLIPENKTFSFEAKKGWMEMDLSDLELMIEEEVVMIGVHWLEIETELLYPRASMSLTAFGGSQSFESYGFQIFERYRGIGAFSIKGMFSYYK